MSRGRIHLIFFVIISCIAILSMGSSAEQKFPSKTIEIVVGYGAGGGVDILARMVALDARKILGVPIIVVNMPGAATVEATNYVQSQPADGYTVFCATPTSIYNNPLSGRVNVMPEDWIPILRAHVDIGSIVVRQESPFKTWQDLVSYAKKNPGKLNWGIVGALSIDEIASSILMQEAGIDVKLISFESGGEAQAALLGGHIDALYEEPGVVMELIESKRMRPILVLSENRLQRFPDVVSMGEMGYASVPMLWRGFFVKKGTPNEVVRTLENAFTKAMQGKIYKAYERESLLDLYPGGFLGSEAFAASMKKEVETYTSVLRKLGYLKAK
ncbi:MAG TPA: tripartite tricarboxylate transporter substrate binding protein [Firmicutes bacterium]|nr:tripartite tricarboxylate transporter substrate binding protein [Bacillota bacterium]